jgi:hypothetical protein
LHPADAPAASVARLLRCSIRKDLLKFLKYGYGAARKSRRIFYRFRSLPRFNDGMKKAKEKHASDRPKPEA